MSSVMVSTYSFGCSWIVNRYKWFHETRYINTSLIYGNSQYIGIIMIILWISSFFSDKYENKVALKKVSTDFCFSYYGAMSMNNFKTPNFRFPIILQYAKFL